MRKRYYIPIAVITLIGAYLYGANAYIYHRIHLGNLPYPDTRHTYTIPGSGAKKIYAALGDSLTAGIGTQKYEESYPYAFAKKMSGADAINLQVFAYPGVTSQNLIDNFLLPAVASKPDIVSVLIGTNDIHNWVSAAQFEKNYRTIIEKLAETHARIYAISIPYIGSNSVYLPPLNYYFDYKTAQFNGIIKRIAGEKKITYIDIATPTQTLFKEDGPLYAADSFHPSAAGYELWANIIYADSHR